MTMYLRPASELGIDPNTIPYMKIKDTTVETSFLGSTKVMASNGYRALNDPNNTGNYNTALKETALGYGFGTGFEVGRATSGKILKAVLRHETGFIIYDTRLSMKTYDSRNGRKYRFWTTKCTSDWVGSPYTYEIKNNQVHVITPSNRIIFSMNGDCLGQTTDKPLLVTTSGYGYLLATNNYAVNSLDIFRNGKRSTVRGQFYYRVLDDNNVYAVTSTVYGAGKEHMHEPTEPGSMLFQYITPTRITDIATIPSPTNYQSTRFTVLTRYHPDGSSAYLVSSFKNVWFIEKAGATPQLVTTPTTHHHPVLRDGYVMYNNVPHVLVDEGNDPAFYIGTKPTTYAGVALPDGTVKPVIGAWIIDANKKVTPIKYR